MKSVARSSSWWRVWCLIGALAPAAPAAWAQGAPASAPKRVRVTVYDSLTRTPLAGALVVVHRDDASPMQRQATDADGRADFQLDTGRWLAHVMHPRYDSIGVALPARWIDVGTQSRMRFTYATPSRRTLTRALCGADMPDSSGVITGFVADAQTQMLVPNASVVIQWTELLLRAGALDADVRRAKAVVDGDGRYLFCGVPTDERLLMWAKTDSTASATAWLDMTDVGFVRFDLTFDSHTPWKQDSVGFDPRSDEPPPARAMAGGAMYRLLVRDVRGRALANAQGMLARRAVHAANQEGMIVFDSLVTGTQMLDVRAVGYLPISRVVQVRDGQTAPDTAVMVLLKTVLDTVRVVARSIYRAHDNGFEQRRRSGLGTFITPEQIARRRPISFSDLLHGVLGVQLQALDAIPPARSIDTQAMGWPRSFGASAVPTMRGSWRGDRCVPTFVVDGVRLPSEAAADIDMIAPAAWIESVEIYSSAIKVPPVFMAAGGDCGVVVVWLKR